MSAITDEAMAFFMGRGWSKVQAAAIVGRLQVESGPNINPTVEHDRDPKTGQYTGIGVAGFRDPKPGVGRKTNLFNYARENKLDWRLRKTQYAFFDDELRTSEKHVGDRLARQTTVVGASDTIMGALRPEGWSANSPRSGMGYKTTVANASYLSGSAVDTSSFSDGGNAPSDAIYGMGPTDDSASTSYLSNGEAINHSPYSRQDVRDAERGAAEERAQRPTFTGAFDAAGQITRDSWPVVKQLESNPIFAPDPEWVPNDDYLKGVQERGIPLDNLDEAHSQAHLEWLVGRKEQDQVFQQKMEGLGLPGTVASIGLTFFDPTMVAAVIASEGMVAPMLVGKFAKLGKVATGATLGVTSNVAAEAALAGMDTERDLTGLDVATAASIGLVWGGAFGALRKNRALKNEAKQIEQSGRLLATAVENARQGVHTPTHSLSAAGVPVVPTLGPDYIDVYQADVPFGFNTSSRYSGNAKMGGTMDPYTRAIANPLGLNATGMADGSVVVMSATERKARYLKTGQVSKEQTYRPALKEFRKDTGQSRAEFNSQAAYGVRNGVNRDGSPLHPAVARMVSWWQRYAKEAAEDLHNPFRDEGGVGRSTQGFEDLLNNPKYLPRLSNPRALVEHTNRFGGNLDHFVSAAFLNSHPTASQGLADRLAKGYLERLRNAAAGIEDGNQGSVGRFSDELRQGIDNLGLTPADRAELDAIAERMDIAEMKGTGPARGKHRVLFDEGFSAMVTERVSGQQVRVNLDDLWINDFDLLTSHYINQAAGWKALGKMRVKNPSQPGTLLINGITSDGDIEKVIKNIRESGANHGLSKEQIEKNVLNARFQFNHLRGIHEKFLDTDGADQAVSWLRDLNYMRVGNQMGFPSMAEFTNGFNTIGWKAMLSSMPSMRRMVDQVTKGIRYKDEFSAEIESAMGTSGDDMLGGLDNRHGEEEFRMNTAEGPISAGITKTLKAGRNVTSTISLLRPVTRFTQLWAARAAANRFAQMARGGKWVNTPELRSLGFASDADVELVLAQMRQHVTEKQGLLGAKIQTLNLKDWDPLPRSMFVDTVNRWTRRVIQENDVGMQGRFMSKPFIKILTQFRGFTLGAWDAQMQHNLYLFQNGEQARALGYFFSAMFSGATFHIARVAAVTALMEPEKRDKYLENQLSPQAIAGAGFSRSAWSSFLPGAMDTVIGIGGFDPMFSYRSTGQKAGVAGFPIADMIEKGYAGIGGLVDSATSGRSPSQQEVGAAFGTLPFSNFPVAIWGLSHLVKDLPKFAPRD